MYAIIFYLTSFFGVLLTLGIYTRFNYKEMKHDIIHNHEYHRMEIIKITFCQFLSLRKITDIQFDEVDRNIISYSKDRYKYKSEITLFDLSFIDYILLRPFFLWHRYKLHCIKAKMKKEKQRQAKIDNNEKLLHLLGEIHQDL